MQLVQELCDMLTPAKFGLLQDVLANFGENINSTGIESVLKDL